MQYPMQNQSGEAAKVENPLLKHAGRCKDDPTYDDFPAEIAAYRRQLDDEEAAARNERSSAMSRLERLVEEAMTLPLEERRQLIDRLSRDTPAMQYAERLAQIREFRGKYKHVFSSTDEFMARKQEEIELEEQKLRRHREE